MTEPIFGDEKKVTVHAKGHSLWTLALPYVTGPARVRIKADEQHRWQHHGVETCGPAGTYDASTDALLSSAPVGALIGKLGGSDAELASAASVSAQATPASKIFAVGSYCVVELKASDSGPLFLTMNDKLAGFANHGGQLLVTVDVSIG